MYTHAYTVSCKTTNEGQILIIIVSSKRIIIIAMQRPHNIHISTGCVRLTFVTNRQLTCKYVYITMAAQLLLHAAEYPVVFVADNGLMCPVCV